MSEKLDMLSNQLQRCQTEKKRFEDLYEKLQSDFSN